MRSRAAGTSSAAPCFLRTAHPIFKTIMRILMSSRIQAAQTTIQTIFLADFHAHQEHEYGQYDQEPEGIGHVVQENQRGEISTARA